jgi:hypothetical protein
MQGKQKVNARVCVCRFYYHYNKLVRKTRFNQRLITLFFRLKNRRHAIFPATNTWKVLIKIKNLNSDHKGYHKSFFLLVPGVREQTVSERIKYTIRSIHGYKNSHDRKGYNFLGMWPCDLKKSFGIFVSILKPVKVPFPSKFQILDSA